MAKNIEKLIVKYLTKTATESDINKLTDMIKDTQNKKRFNDYVEMHAAINCNTNNASTTKTVNKFLKKVNNQKTVERRTKRQSVYVIIAASVCIFTATFIFLNKKQHNKQKINPTIVGKQIEPGTNKATLTLGDGSVVELEKGNAITTQNANSNGEQIVYQPTTNTSTKQSQRSQQPTTNALTIPRGGQFHVVLSDGTEIWLNSETLLKYPVTFIEGVDRQVELIYGEAYFKVKNNATKFTVINNTQATEVLGTQFNIKAYKDEDSVYTTLVEGKVTVNTSSKKQTLLPSQQSTINKNNKTLKVKTVDVRTETAWVNGDFVFSRKPLNDIVKVLSRWYNVDFEFQNKTIESETFSGELSKHQSINEILTQIKNTGIINDYEINETKVTLK